MMIIGKNGYYYGKEELYSLEKIIRDHLWDTKEESEQFAQKAGVEICNILLYCNAHSIHYSTLNLNSVVCAASGEFYLQTDWENAQTTFGDNQSAALTSLGFILYAIVNHGRLPYEPCYPDAVTEEQKRHAHEQREVSHTEYPKPDNCSDAFAAILHKLFLRNTNDYQSIIFAKAELLNWMPFELTACSDTAASDHQENKLKRGKYVRILIVIVVIIVAVIVVHNVVSMVKEANRDKTVYVDDNTEILLDTYGFDEYLYGDDEWGTTFDSYDQCAYMVLQVNTDSEEYTSLEFTVDYSVPDDTETEEIRCGIFYCDSSASETDFYSYLDEIRGFEPDTWVSLETDSEPQTLEYSCEGCEYVIIFFFTYPQGNEAELTLSDVILKCDE